MKPNLLIRGVALLLVPCLFTDPALAIFLPSLSLRRGLPGKTSMKAGAIDSSLFAQNALCLGLDGAEFLSRGLDVTGHIHVIEKETALHELEGVWERVRGPDFISRSQQHHARKPKWVDRYTSWEKVQEIIPDLVDHSGRDLVGHPRTLTPGEEQALSLEIQKGNRAARQALVRFDQYLVDQELGFFIKSRPYLFPYRNDLRQAALTGSHSGAGGLTRAAELWDPSQGPFAPYAKAHIKGTLLAAVKKATRATRGEVEFVVGSRADVEVPSSDPSRGQLSRELIEYVKTREIADPTGKKKSIFVRLLEGAGAGTLGNDFNLSRKRIYQLRQELLDILREHIGAQKPSEAKTPPGTQEPRESLSSRQRDVLELLGKGWSGEEIAAELSLTLRTAEMYVYGIHKKLRRYIPFGNHNLFLMGIHQEGFVKERPPLELILTLENAVSRMAPGWREIIQCTMAGLISDKDIVKVIGGSPKGIPYLRTLINAVLNKDDGLKKFLAYRVIMPMAAILLNIYPPLGNPEEDFEPSREDLIWRLYVYRADVGKISSKEFSPVQLALIEAVSENEWDIDKLATRLRLSKVNTELAAEQVLSKLPKIQTDVNETPPSVTGDFPAVGSRQQLQTLLIKVGNEAPQFLTRLEWSIIESILDDSTDAEISQTTGFSERGWKIIIYYAQRTLRRSLAAHDHSALPQRTSQREAAAGEKPEQPHIPDLIERSS